MKLKNKISWKILVFLCIGLVATSCVAIWNFTSTKTAGRNIEGIIPLEAPSFVRGATAEGNKATTAFPEDEAGISAYINTGSAIDIEKIKTIFSEVQEVGDNYIIGITQISNFGGDIGVHVYADTTGWIVAYIKNDEPAAKIMQWKPTDTDVNNPVIGTITTTTLIDAILKAGDVANVPVVTGNIKYYDFEYPNANGMTIFVKTRATDGTNITQVEIPSTYTLYEASYYHYLYTRYWSSSNAYYDSKLKVDGTTISDAPDVTNGWWRAFDSYKGAITIGTLHTIEISYEKIGSPDDIGSAGVATVLIYKTA